MFYNSLEIVLFVKSKSNIVSIAESASSEVKAAESDTLCYQGRHIRERINSASAVRVTVDHARENSIAADILADGAFNFSPGNRHKHRTLKVVTSSSVC